MSAIDSKAHIFPELRSTKPQQLINDNRDLREGFLDYLPVVQIIFDRAQQMLDEFFEETRPAAPDGSPARPCFPIPVREIAKHCNFLLYEMELANLGFMEQDASGGRTTIAQMQMRERRRRVDGSGQLETEIAGSIVIDKNLGESAKRFAIAHELGHYVLRTQNPIGPLFIEDSCPGPFAYVPEKEFLANEFAYALLLPYSLVKERKKRYEQENQYNPLSYMDWIQVLEAEAQLPQHYAILAYEEIKKRQLAEALELARAQAQATPPPEAPAPQAPAPQESGADGTPQS